MSIEVGKIKDKEDVLEIPTFAMGNTDITDLPPRLSVPGLPTDGSISLAMIVNGPPATTAGSPTTTFQYGVRRLALFVGGAGPVPAFNYANVMINTVGAPPAGPTQVSPPDGWAFLPSGV